MRILLFCLLLSFSTVVVQAQRVLKTKVAISDTIDRGKDHDFGVGDDGIYNIAEPVIKTNSFYKKGKEEYPAQQLFDFDLGTPWVEGKPDYGVGELMQFTFDLTIYPDTGKAFSLNSFFVINGYRIDEETWREYSRVRKMNMYINDSLFAEIDLEDTFRFQWVDFEDIWLNYGKKYKIDFYITEVYPGRISQTAISEIQFSGRYWEF